MQEFIRMVTEQLGVPQESAATASGGLLQMIQQQLPPGQFQELLGQVPGVQSLLASAPTAPGQSGGLMEMAAGLMDGDSGGELSALMGKAGGMLGGQAGTAMQVMGLLERCGIDPGQAMSFITMLLGYLREKIGAERLEQLLAYVPALKQCLS